MAEMKTPTKRDPKTIAAAVLVALIVLVGIVLAVVRTFGDNGGPAGQHGGGGSAQQPAGSTSSCGLPDGDQSIPTSAPDATWELSGKVAAPRNASYGPGNYATPPRSCFAHNPTGALFAAINYYADTTNPAITDAQITERLFVDANSSKSGTDEPDEASPTYQVSGFRIDDATASRVSVAVVVRSTEGPTAGQQAAVVFTLGWQKGDWKVVVPPGGEPPTTALASLSGYVPWSGV
jgi:hypothetical protein